MVQKVLKKVTGTGNSKFDKAGVSPGAREKVCQIWHTFCTVMVNPQGFRIEEWHDKICVFKI